MRYDNDGSPPSRTAQWVAAARTLGGLLPDELRIADDPHGLAYTHGPARALADRLMRHPRLARALLSHAGPLTSFLLWMQLRTRALDDLLLDFVRDGGRQVVLLGAGYDCRALRFRRELRDAALFEVDHPATQRRKIARLPAETLENRVVYASWDFERDELARLPSHLRELGLDASSRVLTIWEGVTMYLGEGAIDGAVRAVHAFGAAGSRLALTYIDRSAIARPHGEQRLHQRLVARAGEPWRFGWDPGELPSWFGERGFRLVSDVTDGALAARFYPRKAARRFTQNIRHIALLEVRPGA
jgi:methyltransferase (TIGR00027 family)